MGSKSPMLKVIREILLGLRKTQAGREIIAAAKAKAGYVKKEKGIVP